MARIKTRYIPPGQLNGNNINGKRQEHLEMSSGRGATLCITHDEAIQLFNKTSP